MADDKIKIDLTMYGIAEVLKWCIERNNGRVAGVDTAGFKHMQALLAERPQATDYFTLDQFWKKPITLEYQKRKWKRLIGVYMTFLTSKTCNSLKSVINSGQSSRLRIDCMSIPPTLDFSPLAKAR